MEAPDYGGLAREVRLSLPDAPLVGVIGSSNPRHPQTAATCRELGRRLADVSTLVVVTGGVTGVGEALGRGFHERATGRGTAPRVLHLLPPGYPTWDYGRSIVIGETFADRREVLARIAPIYVCLEGGPGTEHEARVALQQGAAIVPVGRSGGIAADLHARLARPSFAAVAHWETIGAETAAPSAVAEATAALVHAALASLQ